MKLIVEGSPQDIQFVTAICRDQVRRGKLTLTPVPDTVDVTDMVDVTDSKDVEVTDSKDIPEADDKKPKGAKRTKKSE